MAAKKLNVLIFITIVSCCVAIICCGVALGTNQWYSMAASAGDSSSTKVKANIGLFSGSSERSTELANPTVRDLKVVCLIGQNSCMFSCAYTSVDRTSHIQQIHNGYKVDTPTICSSSSASNSKSSTRLNPKQLLAHSPSNISPRLNENSSFMNCGMWIATIVFIALAIVFYIVSGSLALYNTYRTPFQPILSVFGLYIWNSIAGSSALLAIIMWGCVFGTNFSKSAPIGEMLSEDFTQNNSSLGYSFWILILAPFCSIANCCILYYRSWKIVKMQEKSVKVMNETLSSGDILLF